MGAVIIIIIIISNIMKMRVIIVSMEHYMLRISRVS